jgi:hypothetical protein
VPITGGRGLRHLSRTKMVFGNPDVSRDPWVHITAGTCLAQQQGGRQWVPMWPGMQKRYAWGRFARTSGRFKANSTENGSWMVRRSTWQELMSFWKNSISFA